MFPLPSAIGPYKVSRVLGRGGMGVVYLARDERLDRDVAIKVLDDLEATDETRRQLLDEARTAAAVRHPNVATIYEIGETDDRTPYIVMEYCSGVALSQLIRQGPISGRLFLRIARQVAAGVAAAHRAGIVHRDIKSANIILESDEVVKILDFGLARRFDPERSAAPTARLSGSRNSLFGTIPYIAPEQAEGRPGDKRSDLFSVGVVLYELATTQLPFDHESPIVLLEQIRDAEPRAFEPADPSFPVAAAAVISRLLQKDPVDRYPDADQLHADLELIRVPSGSYDTSSASAHFSRTIGHRALGTKMQIWVSVAAVLILVSGVSIAAWLAMSSRSRVTPPSVEAATGPISSLAVLPLRDLSPEGRDSFLAVSLADALTTNLQQLPGIRVRPTSAVLPLAREGADSATAAATLGVDAIVDGHYISDGQRVRINLQLTDMRSGYAVWAQSVDGKRGDLLGMIDQVSHVTTTGVGGALSAVPAAGTRSTPRSNNQQAYEEFLRARALTGSLRPEESDRQIVHLRRAVELDPSFAAAYADLAIAMSLRQVRGFTDETRPGADAEWYSRQAVRLDPNLPEAHLALGRALIRAGDRFPEAIRENMAALRLNPNDPQALSTMVSYFTSVGESGRAECIEAHLVQQDPSSADALTRGYWSVNRVAPDEALQDAKLALSRPETSLAGHDIAAQAYLLKGDLRAAQKDAEAAMKLVPGHFIGESNAALVAAARGDRESALRHVERFRSNAERNHWASLRIAMVYARLGDREQALRWLERTAANGNHSWYLLARHPWFGDLRSAPRFKIVLKRMRADLDDVRDDVLGVYDLICSRPKGLSAALVRPPA